jgi:transcriptional regulator with XRE-family HTH domain
VRGRPPGSRTLRGHARAPAHDEVTLYARRLGVIVREYREEVGVSSRNLSRAIGMHPEAIAQIERGGKRRSRGPYLETLFRIARALGISPRELMP